MGGFPAARLSDPTVHGGTIVMGCPTVLINNLPAARIGDTHVCPLVTVLVPHVGGPLILGSFTVIVGGMPQSRVTDMLICVGPPDTVINGSPSVMVGMAGAAGVLGVLKGLAMGGWATLKRWAGGGYPRAVRQSDGSYITECSKAIRVEGTPTFQAKAVRDLNLIASTKSGKKLLNSLNSSGKTVRIHIDTAGGRRQGNWAWTDPPPPPGNDPPGYLKSDGTPGAAANTEVGYDPDRTRLRGQPGSPYNTANWAQPPNRPADVGLFHEMVHTDDMTHGRLDSSQGVNTGPLAGSSIDNSELRAAGITPYDTQDYSENTYRSDRGLPARTFY